LPRRLAASRVVHERSDARARLLSAIRRMAGRGGPGAGGRC